MADLQSVAPMLKEVWPDAFETAFSNEIVALSRIEQSAEVTQDYSGRYAVVPMKVRRNQGIGSRAERVPLPQPGKQGYVATRVTLRHQYGVGEITAQALKLADREPRSFINSLDQELSGLRDDVMKDYARQVYGDGTGRLGTVDGAPANDVITVDHIQYFEPEQRLDAIAPGGPTVTATDIEVLSVDVENKTITVDDATGVADTNVLVRTGNFGQEINGFGILIDDTEAVQNLAPSAEPKWASLSYGDGAHNYDELEVIRAHDGVRRASGKQVSVMFTDFGGRRAVFKELKQSREFVNTIEFGHGFSALPFNYGAKTTPLVEDPDYPTDADSTTTSILGVAEDTVRLYREPEGWHFAEETGSMFLAAQDRSDAWEFRMRQFSQMGISQRNCHFRIEDINTDLATSE